MATELLTTREVAALLRVHPKHVYRLLRRGLPARRVGGEWRFARDEVLAWGGGGAAAEKAAGVGGAPRVVAANEDLIVELLLDQLRARPGALLGRVPADSRGGMELLERGEVVACGFHGGDPLFTGGVRHARLQLFERELGLVYPRRRGAPALADLPRVRFAGRPEGAGSRVHLDAALRRQRIDPRRVEAMTFASPRDVACAVARGAADAGVATRAWAARLGLGFTGLVVESYALWMRAVNLGDEAVTRLAEAAQAPAFARAVRAVPGCDPAGAGGVTFVTTGGA